MKLRTRIIYGLYLLSVAAAVCILAQLADGMLGRFLPLSSWPPRWMSYLDFTETSVKTVEYEYSIHINSLGLRGDEIPPKQEGVFRIVVLGDSYVFGWGVSIEDTWIARLNTLFSQAGFRVEVINAGRCATGPIEYAQLTELLLPKLRPDLTLVSVLQGGDMDETPDEWWWLPNFRLLIKDWRDRNAPSPSPGAEVRTAERETERFREEARRFVAKMSPVERERFDKLDDRVKQYFSEGSISPSILECAIKYPSRYSRFLDMSSVKRFKKTAVTAAMLTRIQRIAALNGSRVLALTMPEGAYVNRPVIVNWARLGFDMPRALFGDRACADMIANAARKADVGLLDPTPAFVAHGGEENLFFALDNHMSAAGNRFLAENLFPELEKEIPK